MAADTALSEALGERFVECCMWEGNFLKLPFTVPTKISTLWFTDTCKHIAKCLELNMLNMMHSTETIVCGSSEARTPSHPHHPPGCCGFGMNRFSRGCRNAKGPTGILYNMQIFQGTFNPSPCCEWRNRSFLCQPGDWGETIKFQRPGPHTFGNFVMFLTWCSLLWFKLMQYT